MTDPPVLADGPDAGSVPHAAVARLPQPEPAPLASVQGTLALELTPRLDPPTAEGSGRAVTGDVVPIDVIVRRQLQRWAGRYAQAVVEIVNGDRPASQLVRWTAPTVHDDLVRRAQIVARAGVHHAGLGRGRRPLVRPGVQNVRTCFLGSTVAEVSVHVRHGARSRALACRFELRHGRWLCTALEFA